MRVSSLSLFLTGIVALAVAAWGYNQYSLRRAMELDLNARYQRAFYELLTNTQNLEVLLSKSLVVNGREQAGAIFSSIWQQAMSAQANLAQLPVAPEVTSRTAKFLTQVADYANTLVRRAGTGAPVRTEHWDRLRQLYDQATVLNRELHKVEARLAADGAYFWEINRAASRKQAIAPLSLSRAHTDFRAINREMQQYPTLIYDGPFSDHLERQKPLGLTGRVISPAQAVDRALTFLDRAPGTRYIATVGGMVKGRIEAYRVEVTGSRAGGEEKATCLVSKKGGRPVLVLVSRDIGKARVDVTEAQRRAARYLDRIGFANMRLSYSIRRNGVATFNFVGEQDGVVLYPDMVKVTVALDNGQVIGLDATPYLMAHHPRGAFRPALTLEQARTFLSPRLKVEKGRLAVIPTDGGQEKVTYEFKGTVGPNSFLVYIDAVSGEEVKVLKLIDTPAGTLVM